MTSDEATVSLPLIGLSGIDSHPGPLMEFLRAVPKELSGRDIVSRRDYVRIEPLARLALTNRGLAGTAGMWPCSVTANLDVHGMSPPPFFLPLGLLSRRYCSLFSLRFGYFQCIIPFSSLLPFLAFSPASVSFPSSGLTCSNSRPKPPISPLTTSP